MKGRGRICLQLPLVSFQLVSRFIVALIIEEGALSSLNSTKEMLQGLGEGKKILTTARQVSEKVYDIYEGLHFPSYFVLTPPQAKLLKCRPYLSLFS